MTLYELESKIFFLEGIRVIIRSNRDNFIDTRISGLLKSGEVAVVINGYGEIPNVRTHIGTVRASYNV